MENKTTWASFFAVLIVLSKGFVKVMCNLWKAFVETVCFPAGAAVLLLIALLSFFIGRHYPVQNLESEPTVTSAAMPSMPSQVKPPKNVAVDTSEADKAKAKVKADKAKADAEMVKAKAEEERRKTEEARAKNEAKLKAIVDASKVAPIRDTIIVDNNTVYYYDKDPEQDFYLEEYVDGTDGPVFKKSSKDKPCTPFNRINAKNHGKYMMLKLVSKGYESSIMTFTKENTPAAVVFENGKATVYKDLSVLPVDLVYPK